MHNNNSDCYWLSKWIKHFTHFTSNAMIFSEFTEGQTKIDHVLQRGARICGSDHLRISRAGFCGLVYHFSTYSYQMLMTKTRRWSEIWDLSMVTLNICWYGKIWIDDIYFKYDKDKILSISNKLKTYEYVDYKYILFCLHCLFGSLIVLECPWLLQLLISDDPSTVSGIMELLPKILRCNK